MATADTGWKAVNRWVSHGTIPDARDSNGGALGNWLKRHWKSHDEFVKEMLGSVFPPHIRSGTLSAANGKSLPRAGPVGLTR